MKFEKTVISACAYELPEKIMTSDEIEDRLAPLYEKLKLPYGRLELMSGIKERRYWERGTLPSTIAAKAAENLFEKTAFPKEEVDLLIHASVCRDFLEPSTASVVHANLKMPPGAMIFDLSNACLGVINAMVVAANMIEREQIRSALIVSGENGGPLLLETIDWLLTHQDEITRKSIKKSIASLTIGSAATAILLTHKDLAPKGPHMQLVGGSVMTDSSANVLCQGDGNSNSLLMETDSEKLLAHGITLAKNNWEQCLLNLNWKREDLSWALGHQVGQAHEEQTFKAMELDRVNTYRTYPTLGNTGSSALPITLMQLIENEKIEDGAKMALLGIGSGLTSLMLGVKWHS